MPRLCEPFAGLGSFSLRCLWEAAGSDPRMRWEPPVSRQGSKSGFVINEFRAFGLVRQKWDAVLLNDLDPVCHLFHMLYASSELRDLVARRLWAMVPCPECLPIEVNAALDGQLKPTPESCKRAHEQLWQGTALCPLCSNTGVMDARQLWERIRKEPVPGDLVEACTAGLYMQARNVLSKPATIDDGQWRDVYYVDEFRACADVPGARMGPIQRERGKPVVPRPELASRVSSLPSGMASLADLTARALFLQSRSFQLKPVSIAGGAWDEKGYKKEVDDLPRATTSHAAGDDSPRWTVAERVAALPGKWVEQGFNGEQQSAERQGGYAAFNGARWTAAERVTLLPGPGGCHIGISRMDALEFVRGLVLGKDDVLIVDSPYAGTSGYAHDSPRGDVLEICEIGYKAGALVICHEGVGLAKELGSGWMERSASPLRSRGSTFHAGGIEREWITFNRPVQWWPAHQSSMF